MIRNRLAELISERGLKITRVALDTGISRNTITSTAQNDSKMIQYETINTLCKYLGITPADFFDFSPVDYVFHINIMKRTAETYYDNAPNDDVLMDYALNSVPNWLLDLTFDFELFIDIERQNSKDYVYLEGNTVRQEDGHILISLKFTEDDGLDKLNNLLFEEISAGNKAMFNKDFIELIKNTLNTEVFENYAIDPSHIEELNDTLKIKIPWPKF